VSEPVSVATIVVTYNSAATIRRCLQCVSSSSTPSAVWVVDNASTDGTAQHLGEDPAITVVQSQRNLGFAAACNLGMEAAATRSPSHYLLVNPDAYLEQDCLSSLLRAMESDPFAAMACPLVLNAASGAIWYAGATADVEAGNYWHIGVGERDDGQYAATVVTGRPTGCVLLVRGSVVESVGPMDPSYFLYWEDVEWAMRCKAQGLHTLFVGDARAQHDVSAATGGAASKVYEYYYLRNRLRLVHDTAPLTRRELVAANWRGSVRSVASAVKGRGILAGMQTGRAITLAYLDFLRDQYGQRARL